MTKAAHQEILPLKLRARIQETLKSCYACGRCSSGCPVAHEMEYPPRLLVKALALGAFEKIAKSKTIWVCSSCQTCMSRCPFDINIPSVIDKLKAYAYQHNMSRREAPTRQFHRTFLSQVSQYGRIHEASLIARWKLVSGSLFSDLLLGAKMFLKGKLPIAPEIVKGVKDVRRFFKKS